MGNTLSLEHRKRAPQGAVGDVYAVIDIMSRDKNKIQSEAVRFADCLGVEHSFKEIPELQLALVMLCNVELDSVLVEVNNNGKSLIKVILHDKLTYDTIAKLSPKMPLELLHEPQCIANGIMSLVNIPGSLFTFKSSSFNPDVIDTSKLLYHTPVLPFVFVQLDSGVSFYLVDNGNVKCLGYSPIGVDAILALFHFFKRKRQGQNTTPVDAKKLLELAKDGDGTKCDMLVRDIYGGGYDDVGLGGDIIASSFGKLQQSYNATYPQDDETSTCDGATTPKEPSQEDFARSLVSMLTINVAHHAFLHTLFCNISSVVFGGSLFEHPLYCEAMHFCISLWSQGSHQSYFFSVKIRAMFWPKFHLFDVLRVQKAHFKRRNFATLPKGKDVVLRLQRLALDNCNNVQVLSDASRVFKDNIESLYPLEVFRSLWCFAELGFSNKHIFGALIQRIDDLCQEASPRRLNHLLTLFARLQTSHQVVTTPLLKAIRDCMHKYSVELGDIWTNCLSLGIEDAGSDFYQLLQLQTELKFKELLPLKDEPYRTFESLSRIGIVPEFIDKINAQNLNLKQAVYAIAAFTRLDRRDVALEICNSLCSNEHLNHHKSTLLALMNSARITPWPVLEKLGAAMEHLPNDTSGRSDYSIKDKIYQALSMCKLGFYPKDISKWLSLKPEMVPQLSPVSCVQLLYAIALCKLNGNSTLVDSKETTQIMGSLLDILSCTYRTLSLPLQRNLHECLKSLESTVKIPNTLQVFLSDFEPSMLPLVVDGMDLMHLDGFHCATMHDSNGNLQCVNVVTPGSGMLHALKEDGAKVIISPQIKLRLHAVTKSLETEDSSLKGTRAIIKVLPHKTTQKWGFDACGYF